MANQTNEQNWAARERLRAVEMLLWWRGWAGRTDLIERFGLSPAQASSDFQKYLELNGSQISYQTSRKRYEASMGFECLIHEPRLEEALSLLGMATVAGFRMESVDGSWMENERIGVLKLPIRRARKNVERLVFMALLAGQKLRVEYHSLSSGLLEWRMLKPGALAWDGRRWHVRAWCEKREQWRDFVLGRMSQAEWPLPVTDDVPMDEEWNRWETLCLRLNPDLEIGKRQSLQQDYGLEDDHLELRVRSSMKNYLLAELFVSADDSPTLPVHFVIDPPSA